MCVSCLKLGPIILDLICFFVLGAENCKKEVYAELVDDAERTWTVNFEICSKEFTNYSERLMSDYSMNVPQTWKDGLQQYFFLFRRYKLATELVKLLLISLL